MKKLLFFVASLAMMTSCYTTWTNVGNYRSLEKQGLDEYRYEKDKQFYLFEGLIPLGHSHANTPNEPCEIKSKFNFGDFIITGITGGIISSRTVYVYALKGASNYQLDEVKSEPVQVKSESKPSKAETKKATTKPTEEVAEVEDEIVTKKVATEKKAPAVQTASVSQSTAVSSAASNVKVGDRVVYKLRGSWWYYATVKAISGNNVTIELENGATTDRTLNDVMKVEYIK